MKKYLLLCIIATFCFANFPVKIDYIDTDEPGRPSLPPAADRVLISAIGDIRSQLGPQGKNICVSDNGDAIAVIYGDPTTDPDNYMEIKIGYSLNDGASWSTYGPFSAEYRRIYPSIDGSAEFDANAGELYFGWQETPNGYATGDHKMMIEEGTPAASSPSSPYSLPGSSGAGMCPWFTCTAVDPDDPFNVYATSFSYLNGGNESCYGWLSQDGGYTWTDSIFIYHAIDPISGSSGAGHLRRGTGGYMFMTFHDTIDVGGTPVAYPNIIESTDGGLTWGPKQQLPVPYVTSSSEFWWTELDCEAINNEPWTVHVDLGTDSCWLFHGTGSPGAWSWEVFNVRQLSACSVWSGGTLYYSTAVQYPSIAYDPANNIILVTEKTNYYVGDNVSWATHNGPHVGGIYSTDGGSSWHICNPLSTPNPGTVAWADWNTTETAHRIVDGYAYTSWVHEIELNTYFEREEITPFPGGIQEINTDIFSFRFDVTPNITNERCQATFCVPKAGAIALRLFDATGRLVKTVHDGILEQGQQQYDISTSHMANGTYFLVLETEAGCDTRKLVKVR
jgi:hypothetical protein